MSKQAAPNALQFDFDILGNAGNQCTLEIKYKPRVLVCTEHVQSRGSRRHN